MRIETGSPLHDAVGAAVGHVDVTIEQAAREPLAYDVFLAHREVSRIRGIALSGGERIPWRLIEKTTEGPATASPYLTDNADREYDAYRSGLLDDLAPGVRAPRMLGAHREPGGRVELWLEEIPVERPLDADVILAAAHDLGQLAGRWVGRVPQYPWLFTGWIDRHSQPEALDEGLATLNRRDAQVVARLGDLRGDRLGQAVRLAHEQARVREILEALPQTLCHHDAVGANAFRVAGATVLIDWESIGPGPVGADLASLLFSSARRGDCSATLVMSLVDAAVEAYAAGLAGHAVVPAGVVRAGFEASVALRWKLVRDVADAIENGSGIRRGSAPGEAPENALADFDLLIDLLLDCARRVLSW